MLWRLAGVGLSATARYEGYGTQRRRYGRVRTLTECLTIKIMRREMILRRKRRRRRRMKKTPQKNRSPFTKYFKMK